MQFTVRCCLFSSLCLLSELCKIVSQRTLDEDCRQAEEPKQLADEASRFHLGRQRQHSAVWRFAIQQQSTAPQSGHALLTQVGSMCS